MAGGGISLRELDGRPVSDLAGVGDRKAEALSRVDVRSVLDLLTYYPRRYLDRTREATIGALAVGEEGMVLVRVERVSARRTRGGRSLVEVRVADDTGTLRLTFFNQPWRERQLSEGTEVVVFGRLDRFRGDVQMTNPVVDLVGDRTGRIVAVYPQSEAGGLQSWDMDTLIAEALRRVMMVRGFAMYVKNKLEELADDHIMATPVGGMRLIDYLPTRTFELIIHTMDLAKAVGVDDQPPENGMAATLEILGQIALYRGRASDLVFGVTGRGGLSDGFSVLG